MLANKINLSLFLGKSRCLFTLMTMCALLAGNLNGGAQEKESLSVSVSGGATQRTAQVPPRSEAAQEQREKETPRFVGRECTITPDGYIGPASGPNSNCACGDELWQYEYGPLCISQVFKIRNEFLCSRDMVPLLIESGAGNFWWRCDVPPPGDWLDVDAMGMSVFTLAQPGAEIRFTWEPLRIEFLSDVGKKATILFTEDTVTYSGDISFDESTKMFFDLFWKEYILEQHLKAKCNGVIGQQEE